jgi:O-antigen ligase
LIWAILGNTRIITDLSDGDFFFLISLLFITFLTRQVSENKKTDSIQEGDVNSKKDSHSIDLFLQVLWFLGVCQALIGLGQYFSISDIVPNRIVKTPMIGTIGTANGFGSFIATACVALVVDYLSVRSIGSRIVRWITGGVLITALVLNGSRGAILGLIGSFFIFIALYKNREPVQKGIVTNALDNKKSFIRTFLSSRISRIGITVLSLVIIMGCIGFFLYNLNVESSRGRIFVWRVSEPILADNPIMGVGVGRFSIEYLNYQSRFFREENNLSFAYKAANMKQAHNEYLQAFCESGIIGGILFISIWMFALWFLFRHHYRYHGNIQISFYGIASVLLVILFHGLVDTPLHMVSISVVAYCILGFVPLPVTLVHRIHIKSKMGVLGILILFVIYSGLVISSSMNQYRGHVHWQHGYEYGLQHRWSLAIQEYQDALPDLPQNGELLFHLGAAFVMADSYSSGIYYLQESLQCYNDRNIHLSLSYAYFRMRNLKDAEHYAKTALAMFPDHLAPHLLLGQIFHEQGLFEESKKSLLKCIGRKTSVQSDEVNQIGLDAEELWRTYYQENIPLPQFAK